MPKLYSLARMTTATTGTGTVTLGVAVSGYLSFANAGVQNNDVVFYGIKDGSGSEVGWGTYASPGTTLTRNVIRSTSSNAAITLSGSAEVYITALASDGGDLLPGFTNPMRGFDLPLNLQLNASVASNILTVAVKGNNGQDPGNSNPVLVAFRDSTIANGDPVWVAITSALSINTNAVGASLGAGSSSTPFRFWVVAFNNGGTAVPALINCVGSGQIFALDETSVQSTTPMSASATSAGVFYTPNGTTLTNCALRILGYVEYSTGLTTAGTFATPPTKVQLYGPGVKKPGDPGQTKQFTSTTQTSSSSTSAVATSVHSSITLTSAADPVLIRWGGMMQAANDAAWGAVSLYRGNNAVTTQIGQWISELTPSTNAPVVEGIAAETLDTPFAGATTTAAYTVGIQVSSGQTITYPFNIPGFSPSGGWMTLTEIMG